MKFLICVLLLFPKLAWGENRFQKLINLADRESNNPKAIALYTEALEAWRPPDGEKFKILAYVSRGEANMRIYEYENALSDYNAALSVDYKDPTAIAGIHSARGVAYLGLKDYESALQDSNQAIRLMPKSGAQMFNATIYFNRGALFLEMKEYSRALQDFNTAIAWRPKNATRTDRCQDYLKRGICAFKLKQYKSSLEDLSRAIQIKKNTTAYYYRGKIYEILGDLKGAAMDYSKLAEIMRTVKDDPGPKSTMMRKRGQVEEEFADAHFRLGRINEKSGGINSARREYKVACGLRHESACRALKRLSSRRN